MNKNEDNINVRFHADPRKQHVHAKNQNLQNHLQKYFQLLQKYIRGTIERIKKK